MRPIRWFGLSTSDFIASPFVLGVFIVFQDLICCSPVITDEACGSGADLWASLMYLHAASDIVEWLVACTVFLQARRATRQRWVLLLIAGVSVKAILTGTVLQWTLGRVPDDAALNARYCEWRAEKACWQTPNTTLETYELLFPVTQASLFQRELAQPFRPLETRYEVSVLWNAMTRCRDFSFQDANDSQPVRSCLFTKLPSHEAVDAWCGATYLSRDQEEALLVSYDAIASPAETYGEAVKTMCSDIQGDIKWSVMIHWGLMVCLALACYCGPNSKAPQLRWSLTRRVDTNRVAKQPAVGQDKLLRDPDQALEQLQEAKPSPEAGEPSWVDVPSM